MPSLLSKVNSAPAPQAHCPGFAQRVAFIQARMPQHHPTCRIIVFGSLDSHTTESPGNRGNLLSTVDEPPRLLSSALAAKARRLKVRTPNVFLSKACRRLVATCSARTYRTTLIRSTSIAIGFLYRCPCRAATLILVIMRELTAPHIGKSGELVCLHRRAGVRYCLNA